MSDALMDVSEVAELLGLAAGTVYHLVSQERIPVVRLSKRCVRFRRADIETWILERAVSARLDDRRGRSKRG